MSKHEAVGLKAEAEARGIQVIIDHNGDYYWVKIAGRRWLSYFYGVMALWDLIYKAEGVQI